MLNYVIKIQKNYSVFEMKKTILQAVEDKEKSKKLVFSSGSEIRTIRLTSDGRFISHEEIDNSENDSCNRFPICYNGDSAF